MKFQLNKIFLKKKEEETWPQTTPFSNSQISKSNSIYAGASSTLSYFFDFLSPKSLQIPVSEYGSSEDDCS